MPAKKKLEEDLPSEEPQVKKNKVDSTLDKFFQTNKKVEKKVESKEESKEEEAVEVEKTGTVIDNLTDPSWRKALSAEFKKDYFKELVKKVDGEIKSGKEISRRGRRGGSY
eukprot:TRINITY_DN9006_c0_g1_i3.p1 TRINITY_DN9006_c0_g1~~TRINITY_DN9006_c0_g1_i3.p1  ORF type:complete len:111 (+),score=49.56 TRINITY_DN9006_c0_g1_i3:176-508(+)